MTTEYELLRPARPEEPSPHTRLSDYPPSGNLQVRISTDTDISVIPPRIWAWEFLRRNPEFAEALDRNAAQFEHIGTSGHVRILRPSAQVRPSAYGCIYASSADDDAQPADVLWEPDACRTVLRAVAVRPVAADRMRPFILGRCPLPGTLLIAADGRQHLVLCDGLQQLQLCITGADLHGPVHIFPSDCEDPGCRAGQIRIWSSFLDLQRTGRIADNHARRSQAPQRLRHVLIALDGSRAGACHREIAVMLFGQARVDRDWSDPDDCLRDRVRRAVARGRHLARIGYLQLLRGR